MQWQHGTYTIEANGSLVLTPFAVDGRQVESKPCSYDQSIYTRYKQLEVMKVCLRRDQYSVYEERKTKFPGRVTEYTLTPSTTSNDSTLPNLTALPCIPCISATIPLKCFRPRLSTPPQLQLRQAHNLPAKVVSSVQPMMRPMSTSSH